MGGQVDQPDFMLAVTAMQHGGKFAIRRQRDIHREIPQCQTGACGPQRPLIRQQHGTIRLPAGPEYRRFGSLDVERRVQPGDRCEHANHPRRKS